MSNTEITVAGEVITVETVLSEINSLDLDWAATHLDELFEAGLDAATYRRLERAIEAAEASL